MLGAQGDLGLHINGIYDTSVDLSGCDDLGDFSEVVYQHRNVADIRLCYDQQRQQWCISEQRIGDVRVVAFVPCTKPCRPDRCPEIWTIRTIRTSKSDHCSCPSMGVVALSRPVMLVAAAKGLLSVCVAVAELGEDVECKDSVSCFSFS